MAAERRPLPPPLPPERRTVGQLVAESIRFYGSRFWAVLPLGIPRALRARFNGNGDVGDVRRALQDRLARRHDHVARVRGLLRGRRDGHHRYENGSNHARHTILNPTL